MSKKRKVSEITSELVSDVNNQMARMNHEIPSKKQLFFDAVTGNLLIDKEGTKKENSVVVDQIYKDGFFGYAHDCLIQNSCMSFKTSRCSTNCKLYL